jgi:hypothetical protein
MTVLIMALAIWCGCATALSTIKQPKTVVLSRSTPWNLIFSCNTNLALLYIIISFRLKLLHACKIFQGGFI